MTKDTTKDRETLNTPGIMRGEDTGRNSYEQNDSRGSKTKHETQRRTITKIKQEERHNRTKKDNETDAETRQDEPYGNKNAEN